MASGIREVKVTECKEVHGDSRSQRPLRDVIGSSAGSEIRMPNAHAAGAMRVTSQLFRKPYMQRQSIRCALQAVQRASTNYYRIRDDNVAHLNRIHRRGRNAADRFDRRLE
jgi:hypothetical protein